MTWARLIDLLLVVGAISLAAAYAVYYLWSHRNKSSCSGSESTRKIRIKLPEKENNN